MNLVVLCGNLVRKGELRATKDGGNIYSFTIAVRKRFTKEEQNEEADFISCSSFGKTAENMNTYLDKGSKILIQGRLQVRKYEKDGETKYATNVLVDTCTFLDKKKEEATAPTTQDTPVEIHDYKSFQNIETDDLLFHDDDLPF